MCPFKQNPTNRKDGVKATLLGIGAPCLTSTPIKRPRMEDTVFDESSTYTSNQCSDVTYEPDVTQESVEKVCQPSYKARKYMVYEENLLQLFRKCQACCHTGTVEKFVNGTFVSITQTDTMSRTETTFPPLKATVPLAVWACATQDSNPRPQWLGIRDTWFSSLRHTEDANN
ncbi:hypothetical protein F2P79_025564 [Pimephales promelas]|nr:hypothetical protein F2P79_025564 [Pimephales promelas]